MKITLLACYELGHQPFSLASPLATLREAGFDVAAYDISVQRFPTEAVADSKLIAISTPMHTALRLAIEAAEQTRSLNPEAHITFYGQYAWLNAELLLGRRSASGHPIVDSAVGGEFETPLLALARHLQMDRSVAEIEGLATRSSTSVKASLRRQRFAIPDRSTLPGLEQYANLALNGELLTAGYTESTRGCLYLCRHCPVVPVYNGRLFVVPAATVLADIRQQVEMGARHITFGDPDFLNGPGHAVHIAREMAREFPGLTFDFTTKVEHIIQNRKIVAELATLGAAFVVSAFESTSDDVLRRLQKDHTLTDMENALVILRKARLPVQVTWVPFTPWTSLDDYLHMLNWIREQRLIQHVAPVQLSIRLLVPPGSALLDNPDRSQWAGPIDSEAFSHRWQHRDPRMDELQKQVAAYVEGGGNRGPHELFGRVEAMAYSQAGRRPPRRESKVVEAAIAPPRLTEDWFC